MLNQLICRVASMVHLGILLDMTVPACHSSCEVIFGPLCVPTCVLPQRRQSKTWSKFSESRSLGISMYAWSAQRRLYMRNACRIISCPFQFYLCLPFWLVTCRSQPWRWAPAARNQGAPLPNLFLISVAARPAIFESCSTMAARVDSVASSYHTTLVV